ncbi:MAG TPA: hypothetical protein PKE27_17540 [Povalibacter sp.]|uniref:hypothetical protein n=1 Tax=Povalibacter sp. TaxID=1962978 RepID=UPI002C739E40|nr:hypothetical protein [Povalibacter sp.]HMN46386.1 hypothetical protein [Povalibacter sp.]
MSISFIDPPNVRHLGELASLKKAILAHFDGDSGLRFHSDEDRWRAIIHHYSPTQRGLIAGQIRELISRDDDFVLTFWNKHSDYFGFATADEVRAYLGGKLELFA